MTRFIIGDTLIGVQNDVLPRLPKKYAIERYVQRRRKSAEVPIANPRDLYFDIPQQYRVIVLDDTGINDPHRIIALGDEDILRQLETRDDVNPLIWFGDGTFKVVPEFFFHLYTIHTKIGNNYPPCIYFLLPNKTENTYRRMVTTIKRLVPNDTPDIILLDFEIAVRNAFQDGFPNTVVAGCFFHLTQSVVRKVAALGLKQRYETDIEFATLVKSLSCLSFVPLGEVEFQFNELVRMFPAENYVQDILLYFEDTYIVHRGVGGVRTDPRFPPACWNYFNNAEECLPKTTNCMEGYHNALKAMFLCQHPNVWVLFNGLKRDIAAHRLTLQQALVQNPERRRRKYIEIMHRLSRKVANYFHEADVMLYLRYIAHTQVA